MARDMWGTFATGKLGQNVTARPTRSGKIVVNGRMVINLLPRDWHPVPEGERVPYDSLWVDLVFWGKIAERAERQLRQGQRIFVRGSLRVDTWVDRNKFTRVSHEITVDDFTIVEYPRERPGGFLSPTGVAPRSDDRSEEGQEEPPVAGSEEVGSGDDDPARA